MAMLEKIIAWGKKQDSWLQDALVRVIQKKCSTELDVEKVAEILLYECGIVRNIPTKPATLSSFKTHSDGEEEHGKVILKKMYSLKNVNSLSKDSSLNFGERGLTIGHVDVSH